MVIFHFTIDVEMSEADYKAMVRAENVAEDSYEHCPMYVAGRAFAHEWLRKYDVDMDVQSVSSTGDQRNMLPTYRNK